MKYTRKKYLKLVRQIERLSPTCSSLSDIDVRNSCTYIKCAKLEEKKTIYIYIEQKVEKYIVTMDEGT